MSVVVDDVGLSHMPFVFFLIKVQPPIFQVTVNDTSPIFFYCSAPGACIDDGMIGVINPVRTAYFYAILERRENSISSEIEAFSQAMPISGLLRNAATAEYLRPFATDFSHDILLTD
jgi:hypothetical protein